MHNLFINISLVNDYPMRNYIHSLSLNVEGMDENVRPRVFYPCLPTAKYLNEKFGARENIVATVLLGADNVSF